VEPAVGNSDVSCLARTVCLCVAPEIALGNDCVLVVSRGDVVFARVVHRNVAFERGRHTVSGGRAPEIHSVCSLFSSGHPRFQTLAPAPSVARFFVARISLTLLRCVRVVLRKPAHPNRVVHLLRYRLGSMPFPGVAQEFPYAIGPNDCPVLLRHIFAPLLCDVAWVRGLRESKRRAANRDFCRDARNSFGNPLSQRRSAFHRGGRQGVGKTRPTTVT